MSAHFVGVTTESVFMCPSCGCVVTGSDADGEHGQGCPWWGARCVLCEAPIEDEEHHGRCDACWTGSAGLPFGGTDCALPMVWAKEHDREFDAIHVYTDNETWAGRVHPHQALRQYREASGIDARSAVVGMTSTGFTIADPSDPGMLDVVGMDAAVPNLLAGFARGF